MLLEPSGWDDGFLGALTQTWIVVPVLSTNALSSMKGLDQSEAPDNFLLEMMTALELQSRGDIQAVIPVILPSPDGEAFEWTLPQELSRTEHAPTTAIARKSLQKMLPPLNKSQQNPKLSGLSTLDGVGRMLESMDTKSAAGDSVGDTAAAAGGGGKVTTAGVVTAILRFQGVIMPDRTSLSTATDRIFSKATQIMNSEIESDESGGTAGAASILGTE